MTDQPAPDRGGRRPIGVVVVALIQVLRAGLVVAQLIGLSLFPDLGWFHAAIQLPEPAPGTVAFVISRTIAVALIVASLLVAYGLLRSRHWAWIAAILISGLSLAFALGSWWDGEPEYFSMAINVVAVFYLNQREVQAAFEAAERDRRVAGHVVQT